MPHQIGAVIGEVSATDETYDASANPPTYSWVIINGGYGNYLRTFEKQ